MGYRIVVMNCELFEQLFVEGYTLPDGANRRLRVTAGLPQGAKLEAISMEVRFMTNQIALRFSHPSWPDEPRGRPVPELCIKYAMEETTEFRPWMLDSLSPAERQELTQQLVGSGSGGT